MLSVVALPRIKGLLVLDLFAASLPMSVSSMSMAGPTPDCIPGEPVALTVLTASGEGDNGSLAVTSVLSRFRNACWYLSNTGFCRYPVEGRRTCIFACSVKMADDLELGPCLELEA